jgi:hypothetical protein
MLNLVQHPWRNAGRTRDATVTPWTLNQAQGDGVVAKVARPES